MVKRIEELNHIPLRNTSDLLVWWGKMFSYIDEIKGEYNEKD